MHLVKIINIIYSVDTSNCPFDSGVDVRLAELGLLLDKCHASLDDWDESTVFADPNEFYSWLYNNKSQDEELVFSHGDLTSNIFINNSDYYFNDLGRTSQ